MKKLTNVGLALIAMLVFNNISDAQAVKASYSIAAEEPLKVTYLGDDGEFLRFQVTVLPNEHGKTRFVIDDKNEGELYSSGVVSNLNLTTVKIEKKKADQVLNFKLMVRGKTYSKSFSVNTDVIETTTVAEGDVTRL